MLFIRFYFYYFMKILLINMTAKSFLFLLILQFIIPSFSTLHSEPLQIDVKADAAILMNADTGAILYKKNERELHYPASTTKVATALYILKFKRDFLDKTVAASQEALVSVEHEAKRKSNYSLPSYWLEPDGSHIGIKVGEEFSMVDLLKGMLISSGNDASNVLAITAEESIPVFMDKMNSYLKSIGCQNTLFTNPHGLHDPKHQTTAYDLALITKEALKDPLFCDIVKQTRFSRPKTNKQKATTLLQTNRLLRKGQHYYPKAIGVKTGYHSRAMKTFVGAARSNGRTLIYVSFKNADRSQMFKDAIRIFDLAFNQPKIHHVMMKSGPKKFTQAFDQGSEPLQTYLKEDLSLDYYPAEDPQAKCTLVWDTLALPIVKDQRVGELRLVNNNGILVRADLLSANHVGYRWPYSWWRGIKAHPIIVVSLVILGAICIFWIFRGKRT